MTGMADESDDQRTTERPATPWWVKLIGIALLVVLVLAAIIFLASGGRHGPGIHGSADTAFAKVATSTHLVEAAWDIT